MSIISFLANLIGASEPALRLLLSILAGYPLAAIYNKYIQNLDLIKIQLFFILSGVALCALNYGSNVIHSAIAVLVTYALCRYLTKSKYLVIINFAFHMGYLLIGYILTESNEYDFKWTMPHCVLVLRLIGLGFDVSDGHQVPDDKLSKDQKLTALKETPTLLELAAFTYFPSSVLVGPQFPFRRYKRYVNGEFKPFNSTKVAAGLKRGGIGVVYLAIMQIGSMILPDSHFLTDDFASQSYISRIVSLGLWGKFSLYKYISIWLLTEGALICFGLTYAGKTSDGQDDWSGCSNVKLKVFEMATQMDDIIRSFNVNTNLWSAQYVFKRLKFLNNRTISHGGTLLFLALWHGYHSGYYMTFFLEFAIITMEKQFKEVWAVLVEPNYSEYLKTSAAQAIIFGLMKAYNFFATGWSMVPFLFLSYKKWLTVYSAVNYYGYIVLGTWFTFYFIYKKSIKKHQRQRDVDAKIK